MENDDFRHFKITGVHLHAPDARKIGVQKVKTKLKVLAQTTKGSTSTVLEESKSGAQKSTIAQLPTDRTLSRAVNKWRQNSDAPKNPNDLCDLNINDACQMDNGKNFLLFDSGTRANNNRLIIFGTRENLKFMAQCSEIYMDGTFKITPRLFHQLYTIHGN